MKFHRIVTLCIAAVATTSARAGGITTYIASPAITAEIGAEHEYLVYGDPVLASVTFSATDDQGGNAYDMDSEYVDGNFNGYVGDPIQVAWQVTDDNGVSVGTLGAPVGTSITWTPACPGTFIVRMTVTNPTPDPNGSSAIDVPLVKTGWIHVYDPTQMPPSNALVPQCSLQDDPGKIDKDNRWWCNIEVRPPYESPCASLDDPSDSAPSSSPCAGDPVNLVTGAEQYTPAPDIEVYNPNGPSVSFARTYNSAIAQEAHNSRGLWLGWMHNWDISIYRDKEGNYTLIYPNGADESITFDSADPASPTHADGRPYVSSMVQGVNREADVITLESANRMKRIFRFQVGSYRKDPLDPDTADGCRFYTLQEMRNGDGRSIYLSWSVGIDVKSSGDSTNPEAVNRNTPTKSTQNAFKLDKIEDDSLPRLPLLTLTYMYDGNGHDRLDYITDVNGRVVTYGSQVVPDLLYAINYKAKTTVLSWVSPPLAVVVRPNLSTHLVDPAAMRWTYRYTPRTFRWQWSTDPNTYRPYLWESAFLLTGIQTINRVAASGQTAVNNQTSILYYDHSGQVAVTGGQTSTYTIVATGEQHTQMTAGRMYVYNFPQINLAASPISIPTCHPDILGTLILPNPARITGNGLELIYDDNLTNRVVKIDPVSHKPTGSYEAGRETFVEFNDPANPFRPTQVTDENGRVTNYQYDTYGNQISVTTDCATGTITSTVKYSYDYFGQTGYPHSGDPNYPVHKFPQLDWVETQVGDKTPTTVFFDGATGKVTQVKSPVPGFPTGTGPTQSTILRYTALGNLWQVEAPGPKDGLPVTFTLQYPAGIDERYGQPLSVEDPLHRFTYFVYSGSVSGHQVPYGTIQSVKDGANYGSEFTYDLAFNIKTATQLHLPGTTTTTRTFNYAYPDGAPLVSVVDSRLSDLRTVNLRYDTNGRPQSVYGANGTNPETQPLDVSRDVGALHPDPLHRVTRRYDEMALSSTGDPSPSNTPDYTGYTYSRSETSTSYTLSNTVKYPLGDKEVYSETHPKSCTTPLINTVITRQTYGVNGVCAKDGSGRDIRTSYLFNGHGGELTDVKYEVKTTAGEWIRYNDPNGFPIDLHYTYDKYSRVVTATKGGVALTDSYVTVTTYTYDDLDNVTSVTTSYPVPPPQTTRPSYTITYAYYPDGSRKTMTVPTALQGDGTYTTGNFTYAYNDAGQLVSLTNPFTEVTSWSYASTNGWLARIDRADGGYSTFSYDSNGQLASLINTNYLGNTSSSFTGMQYDLEGNLKSVVTFDDTGRTYETYSGTSQYTYDNSSQLKTQLWNGAVVGTYSYNNSNKGDNLRTFNDTSNPQYNFDDQPLSGIDAYVYDADGNPTTYKDLSVTFDAEGRLSTYNGGDLLAEYNGDGLRDWKQTASGRTYFVYDGATPLLEMDSLGNVIATTTFGATGLVSRRAEYRGIIVTHNFELDPSGNVINGRYLDRPQQGWQRTPMPIDPFGGPRSADAFGFAGQGGAYRDDETGLVLMGYRYYDPTTGRFLTRDPIGYAGGSNLYAYSGNNPLNYMDPLGLDWVDDASDFSNGFVDRIGFGWITHPIQDWLGVSDQINRCSSAYSAGQTAGTVYNAVNTAANVYSIAKSIPNVVRSVRTLPETISNLKSEFCFTAGTQVVMWDGSTRPIEQVKTGDLVLTRDQNDDANGKVVAKRVLSTSVREAQATITVTLTTGEKIDCTPEHPFYVESKGFVEAKDLGIGTSIVTRAGPGVQVASVERHDAPATVHNLVVEDTHTYFVGTANSGVEVHNGPCGTELHHIFPQEAELAERFDAAGIQIHEFKMKLDTDVHIDIHRGFGGGRWNQAWKDYFNANPGAQRVDIFRQAGKMIYDFGIDGIPLQ